MEPAKIDWKRIDSRFVEDVFYEHFRAPKWFDFLDPDGRDSVDDEAWFCRPECNHAKTAEDFLRKLPASKLPSANNGDEIPTLRDRNQRDGKLKRRGHATVPFTSNDDLTRYNEDGENQNPNVSTPPNHQAKSWKAGLKSSSVKSKNNEERRQNENTPKLKSTLSARNLFAGKDILGHITEFCNELKKLATRVREREAEDKSDDKKSPACGNEEEESSSDVLDEQNRLEKERKPLLDADRATEKGSAKEKQKTKKRVEDAENIPIPLNLESIKQKEPDLLQIRTNPPSPQCFSATRTPATTTPSKAPRSRLMERGVLREVVVEKSKEVGSEEDRGGRSVSIVDTREQRSLDVLWFLKPCALHG